MVMDWKSIRPLNGGRDRGFEELCGQLARAESPPDSEFVRKGTPDAGVECYAILNDGSEWGWQAKYFDRLGGSQWSQLDDSVKTAIEKHPRLRRYFVCVPFDRPDARIAGRKSAKERWDDRVGKWTNWASAKGMAVEFVYWGSHELLERLTLRQHVGRLCFWFDVRGFDEEWFSARLDESLQTAGPRYTPEIHVELPIAWKFEAFGRTDRFFDWVKALARKIRENLRTFEYSEASIAEPTLAAAAAAMTEKVRRVLDGFDAVKTQPAGCLPFKMLAEQLRGAATAAEELLRLLAEHKREQELRREAATGTESSPPSYQSNPLRVRRLVLDLSDELWSASGSLLDDEDIAGSALMLLRGDAGTGKTHLLCDVARQRVADGHPTVLLMGQRFVSNDAPWTQALQQLDMADLTAEKFVGALESAAQAAGSRALLLIDAINEGTGRIIWPSHLAAFLAHLERSPWIGVVLAVRSSYEEIVVPAEVRERAVVVTHQGFTGHEYDATKTFFIHYELELPSTPLLAPEFRNPLFLKTLCRGLQAKGERRLPRGFQGITTVFDLYLSAVNQRLASILGFDPRTPLVRQALEALSEAFLASRKRWLTLTEAKKIVNGLLPGRDFERSLYRGLVVEGVLVEEALQDPEEAVFVAYERFADHLAAKTLLDRHLDVRAPASAFAQGRPLAFICDEKKYVSLGLLEALCIQIPERTGEELIAIAPRCVNHWGLGAAFRQSIIWRAYAAFSDGTREALNKLCGNEYDLQDTLDALLTVATLSGHPLNAVVLDRRLREDAMPDRDAWWSVYLHQEWGNHGAVDRLVDWANSLTPNTLLDDETVDLCAISLAWMLTTSNRFLRDRATKALVSLLTGRLTAVVRLVERFADIDDPYVAERVYAVAYGTAMRCHDPVAVGDLAACVYARIFATGSPPQHILLRDYARGVVERALCLGSAIEVVADHIRPPYKSQWPAIPTEDDIKPLLPNWSHDSRDLEWGRNLIGDSVMEDDFARYVIGTNASSWLSLGLDESPRRPPPRPEDQSRSREVADLEGRGEEALPALEAILTGDHDARRPPRFDLGQIKRYILWRVFNLGWTTKRFGHFDRFSYSCDGREASKAERIGKKYQWIAYHEIMALVADHFQYCEFFREEDGDQAYDGPWKEGLRDIDPSCTMRASRGGTSWEGHAAAWWGSARYDHWGKPGSPREWVLNCDDLPNIAELLIVTDPTDGSRWLNGQGDFSWTQQPPPDRESIDVERRELFYTCRGYLIRAAGAPLFLKWAEGGDFLGSWMPDAAVVYRMFLGEHAWAPASRYFQQRYDDDYGEDGWAHPNHDCPVKIRTLAFEYLRETGGFDCSIDESYTLLLPGNDLVTGLGIRWSGLGADFVDAADRVAAQDPTVHADGPSALLLREDLLREFLAREDLTICWAVLGGKRIFPPEFRVGPYHPAIRMSGAYVLSEGTPIGFVKHMLDEPNSQGRSSDLKVVRIVRHGPES